MDIQAIIFDFSKAACSGMRETMRALRKRGYRLACGFEDGACDAVLERNENAGADFLLAAKRLGVAPEKCAVVEEECERLCTVKEVGMTAIGIGAASACIYADMCIGEFSDLTDVFI